MIGSQGNKSRSCALGANQTASIRSGTRWRYYSRSTRLLQGFKRGEAQSLDGEEKKSKMDACNDVFRWCDVMLRGCVRHVRIYILLDH